jgi:hypothetical protein
MSLVLQSSGGGSVTLQEAVTASNLTITVPAVTGTMLTTASAGTVLQVLSATLSTSNVSTTSSTRSDTGLTITITPSSSSSKILVTANVCGCGKFGGSGGGPYLGLWLMRNSTDITKFEGEGGYTANTSSISFGSCAVTYLDSPATTSATTYKVQFSNPENSGTVGFNKSSSVSQITVMEISA